jgi:hypothetical protein
VNEQLPKLWWEMYLAPNYLWASLPPVDVDVRRAFNDPLAEGYYDNCQYVACARSATTEEVVNGLLSHAVKMIKKEKSFVDEEYLRSSIAFLETKRSFLPEITDVRMSVEGTYLFFFMLKTRILMTLRVVSI